MPYSCNALTHLCRCLDRWGIEWYWADDGDSNSGSGGNSVQSATSIRAVVPAKATRESGLRSCICL